MSWKQQFNRGEQVVIKGITFELAHVGKRGLALRKKTEIPPKPPEEARKLPIAEHV